MSRTLNVDRMWRYLHRADDDTLTLSRRFIEHGDARPLLDQWGQRMERKHGHRISGESWFDEQGSHIKVAAVEGCTECERGRR